MADELKKQTIFSYPCPRCGVGAEVSESARAFLTHLLPPPLSMRLRPDALLVEGRIKMNCPRCGNISDQMWTAVIDCSEVDDDKVAAIRNLYIDKSKEMWERMRRGEPEPVPGPSNCEYIHFEGMEY